MLHLVSQIGCTAFPSTAIARLRIYTSLMHFELDLRKTSKSRHNSQVSRSYLSSNPLAHCTTLTRTPHSHSYTHTLSLSSRESINLTPKKENWSNKMAWTSPFLTAVANRYLNYNLIKQSPIPNSRILKIIYYVFAYGLSPFDVRRARCLVFFSDYYTNL
jgi:hypothetical protein